MENVAESSVRMVQCPPGSLGHRAIVAAQVDKAKGAEKSQRFTSVVRRGLRQILDMGLDGCVETGIRKRTGPGLSRAEKLTAAQVAELRAAVVWIQQEAAQ